jgi:hypothetical protein
VYITLEARGAEFGENVKAHRNIPGASPRDGEEQEHNRRRDDFVDSHNSPLQRWSAIEWGAALVVAFNS